MGSALSEELSSQCRRLDRRQLLQGGSLICLAAALGVGRVAAQGRPPVNALTGPFTLGNGLPRDWEFITPTQWRDLDLNLFGPATAGATPIAPVPEQVLGTRLFASGEIDAGTMDPVGRSVELDPALADIVGGSNERLKLDVLNRDFNPLSNPRSATGEAQHVIGPFARQQEIFYGRLFVPVRFLMSKAFQSGGLPETAMRPLLDNLSEMAVVNTPAHQFRIGATLGNRIVFYNGSSPGHKNVDRLVHAMSRQNMRLIKLMVHFDSGAQGGTAQDIVTDGVGGATHVGGFSAGFNESAQPIAVKSDWPSNYGWLGDDNRKYNAHLLAVDYSGGTHEPLPAAAAAAYCHNADMWDCCAAMLVPFASGDPNPSWRNYQYNPLEVHDQKSARNVAAALATFDSAQFLSRHGAFYCAEGQFVVANLGPQEDAGGGTLLKKSKFGNTEFGRRIDNFGKAPGYADMPPPMRRTRPAIGWDYLASLGAANGGISADQLRALRLTDRAGIYLDWVDEDIRGWQAYRPRDSEGLVARPMTVATMVWGLFRRYMPRERIAKVIVDDIQRSYAAGNNAVKEAVKRLTNGKEPNSAEGQVSLTVVATKAATSLQLGLLGSDEVRTRLLDQAGFREVSSETDKQAMMAAYGEFLQILQNADYSTQARLDEALFAADAKLSRLVVLRNYYNPVTDTTQNAKSSVMLYAAPSCFGMWAQYPFLAGTDCIRYVATAMHTDQAI